MKQQRVYGIILVLASILVIIRAAYGTTMEEQDVTVVFFLLPLGIYALVTKRKIVYDSQDGGKRENSTAGEEATSTGGKRKTHINKGYI